MPGWDTVAAVLNDAAVELGLTSADVADPYASTDPNLLQLARLLRGLGQDLCRAHAWSHLVAEASVSVVAGTAAYALPADYLRMLDTTHWDRTAAEELAGPVSAQEWQALRAHTSTTVRYHYRVRGDQMHLYPTPTATATLAYEYVSRYWVRPAAQSAPTTESPTAATDTLYFDRRLLVAGLKVRYLSAKGFDAQAAQAAYEDALAAARGGDGAAPVLALAPCDDWPFHDNVPETGYGQ